MNEKTLEELLLGIDFIDRLHRVESKVSEREWIEPKQEKISFFTSELSQELKQEIIEALREPYELVQSVSVALSYSAPATVGITAANYSKPDTFYVHVPSWIKVHRAPFQEFGSSLFGLAYTTTGDVHVREDLHGNQFSEVLFHEVLHQLYPHCSESEIRHMVLARMGNSAEIHTSVTRP